MAGTHARLSASGASRWMECPGSVHLSALFDNEESEYAAEGTLAHALAEACLREGTDPVLESEDAEMGGYVQEYVDYVRSLGGDLRIEMPLSNPEFGEDFGGTADAVVIRDGVCFVVDLKYGAGIPVEVEGNVQLLYYAFGVLSNMPENACDTVSIVVVQPRAVHVDGVIRVWSVSAEYVRKWGTEELLPAMRRVDAEPDTFSAGEHCRFCPAKLACPAMKDAEEEIMNLDTGALEGMSDTSLSLRYERLASLRMLIKAVEDECYKRAMKGAPVPGTKLVYGRSSREWKDAEAEREIIEAFGEDAFTDPKVKSPSQVEKLPGGKAAAAKHAYKKEGNPTLVPEGKTGVEYKPERAGSAFAVIDTGDSS